MAQQDKLDEHAPLDNLVDQIRIERLPALIVATHLRENLRLEAPVLEHLRRRLDEVARDRRPVEPRETRLAEQPVEDVAHLVEEGHDVVVPHQRGLRGRRLREVRDHRRERVRACPVRLVVPREQRPDRGVGVLRRCCSEAC